MNLLSKVDQQGLINLCSEHAINDRFSEYQWELLLILTCLMSIFSERMIQRLISDSNLYENNTYLSVERLLKSMIYFESGYNFVF